MCLWFQILKFVSCSLLFFISIVLWSRHHGSFFLAFFFFFFQLEALVSSVHLVGTPKLSIFLRMLQYCVDWTSPFFPSVKTIFRWDSIFNCTFSYSCSKYVYVVLLFSSQFMFWSILLFCSWWNTMNPKGMIINSAEVS